MISGKPEPTVLDDAWALVNEPVAPAQGPATERGRARWGGRRSGCAARAAAAARRGPHGRRGLRPRDRLAGGGRDHLRLERAARPHALGVGRGDRRSRARPAVHGPGRMGRRGPDRPVDAGPPGRDPRDGRPPAPALGHDRGLVGGRRPAAEPLDDARLARRQEARSSTSGPGSSTACGSPPTAVARTSPRRIRTPRRRSTVAASWTSSTRSRSTLLFGLLALVIVPIYSVLRVLGSLPIPGLKDAVSTTQIDLFLTNWFGDVRILLADRAQAANLRTQMATAILKLRAYGVDSVVVVAHSGGTVLSYMLLADPFYDDLDIDKFITHGQALGMAWTLGHLEDEVRPDYDDGLRAGDRLMRLAHHPRPDGTAVDAALGRLPRQPRPGAGLHRVGLAEGHARPPPGQPGPGDKPDQSWTVFNRMSVRNDHGGYWDNEEQFVIPLLRELDTPGRHAPGVAVLPGPRRRSRAGRAPRQPRPRARQVVEHLDGAAGRGDRRERARHGLDRRRAGGLRDLISRMSSGRSRSWDRRRDLAGRPGPGRARGALRAPRQRRGRRLGQAGRRRTARGPASWPRPPSLATCCAAASCSTWWPASR